VEYEPLPVVLDPATAHTAPPLFPPGTESRLRAGADETPHEGGNLVLDIGWPDSDRSGPSPFEAAEGVVELRAVTPRQSPAPIEPRAVACR
jgi:CO/xanthine dehydrogenase Mo-binding subunit